MTKNLFLLSVTGIKLVISSLTFIALAAPLFFASQAGASVVTFTDELDELGYVRFVLIDGNTAFSQAELSSLVVSLTSKKQSLQGMPAIAEKLAQKYRAAGYSKAVVSVPEQSIRGGGFVTLKIEEGAVAKEMPTRFVVPLLSD